MTVIPRTLRFEERFRSTQETKEVGKLGAYGLTRWRHIVAFRAELPPLSPQFGGVRSALVGEGRLASGPEQGRVEWGISGRGRLDLLDSKVQSCPFARA